MSGGHFEYEDMRIRDIVNKLSDDIKYNDVSYTEGYIDPDTEELSYGYQHSPEVIGYIKKMAKDLIILQLLLHKYDYAVSGDTDIEDFIRDAREVYK